MILNDGFGPLDGVGGSNDGAKSPKIRTGIPSVISPEEFQDLLMAGRIVDGRMGGTLLGKGLGDGNARSIFKFGSEYVMHGTLAGGDFIVNKDASAIHRTRLNLMNAGMTRKEKVQESVTDEIGQLIVSTAYPHDRIIWLDFGQLVVTGEAAQRHVVELGRLNLSPNPYLVCDLYAAFHCVPGTEDGIV